VSVCLSEQAYQSSSRTLVGWDGKLRFTCTWVQLAGLLLPISHHHARRQRKKAQIKAYDVAFDWFETLRVN